MDRRACWAAVHGVAKSRTWLGDFTFIFHFHTLEKEMATHTSVLAWRIPGTGEPGGLPSMGSHRVGHDWSDLATAAAASLWTSSLIHSTQVRYISSSIKKKKFVLNKRERNLVNFSFQQSRLYFVPKNTQNFLKRMLDFAMLSKPVKTSVSEKLCFLVVRCWGKKKIIPFIILDR